MALVVAHVVGVVVCWEECFLRGKAIAALEPLRIFACAMSGDGEWVNLSVIRERDASV